MAYCQECDNLPVTQACDDRDPSSPAPAAGDAVAGGSLRPRADGAPRPAQVPAVAVAGRRPGPVVLAGASADDGRLAVDASKTSSASAPCSARASRRWSALEPAAGLGARVLKVGSDAPGMPALARRGRRESATRLAGRGQHGLRMDGLLAPAKRATSPAYRIERLEARPGEGVRKVIAVLDDDQDLTNSICAHLEASGYDARPFFRTADLVSSSKAQRYDGFVIDWIVGETSTLKLIAALRADDAACPIVVLTAQVTLGRGRRGRHRRGRPHASHRVQREAGAHVDPVGDAGARRLRRSRQDKRSRLSEASSLASELAFVECARRRRIARRSSMDRTAAS